MHSQASERNFQVPAYLLQWASESLISLLKNPPFGNAVPESLYQTAVLCMSKMSLIEIGQRSSCGPQQHTFFAVLRLFRKIRKVFWLNPVLYVIRMESVMGRLHYFQRVIRKQSLLSRPRYVPPPLSTPARRAAPRSSLASRPAVPSPSAAAASQASRRPVPPSATLAAPRSRAAWGTGRKVLPTE